MDMDVASPAEVVGPVVADSIWQLACARAELTPDRVLIVDENDRVLTFGELRDQAESVAAGLYELGILLCVYQGEQNTLLGWLDEEKSDELVEV